VAIERHVNDVSVGPPEPYVLIPRKLQYVHRFPRPWNHELPLDACAARQWSRGGLQPEVADSPRVSEGVEYIANWRADEHLGSRRDVGHTVLLSRARSKRQR
jgi:hypothetical protein